MVLIIIIVVAVAVVLIIVVVIVFCVCRAKNNKKTPVQLYEGGAEEMTVVSHNAKE